LKMGWSNLENSTRAKKEVPPESVQKTQPKSIQRKKAALKKKENFWGKQFGWGKTKGK